MKRSLLSSSRPALCLFPLDRESLSCTCSQIYPPRTFASIDVVLPFPLLSIDTAAALPVWLFSS